MPPIKWPKKKPKEEKESKKDPEPGKEARLTLAGVDGTLRKLGEKELLLEIPEQRFLRFRLIAKTEFRNLEDKPIRDSLLKPGDLLRVEVNPEDEETALRVVLNRPGTEAERAAAGKPVDPSGVRAPKVEDFDGGAAEPAAERQGAAKDAPERPLTPDEQVIEAAREAASTLTANLPDFLVEQETKRAYSSVATGPWQTADVVTAEVACVNGKEEYRNVRVNGQPSREPLERSGAWSTGEFVTTLGAVLSPATRAKFTRRGEEKVGARQALVFEMAVEKDESNWILNSQEGQTYTTAYRGRMWIDKASRRVLKLEQKAAGLPASLGIGRAETTIEYGFVDIEGKMYLLPVSSENLGCRTASLNCFRNTLSFRNYRKFTASSTIKY